MAVFRRNRALAAGEFSADRGEYVAKRRQVHNSLATEIATLRSNTSFDLNDTYDSEPV
jgi:hypothetical protein